MPLKKSKTGTEASKLSAVKLIQEEVNEPVPESKPKTINIYLENYQNIKSFFPIADIQISIKYGENVIGVTSPLPITDDDVIFINESFAFTIDANNPKELDALISSPATIFVDQIQGSLDKSLYPQMQLNSQLYLIPPAKSFDSIVSMYEALTNKKIEMPQERKEKKSKKKGNAKSSEKPKTDKVSRKESNKIEKMSNKSTSSSLIKKTSNESIVVTYDPTVFGMCCLDFLPLFYGQKKFTQALLIKPIVQYLDNRMLSFKAHPKVIVTVSIEEDFELREPTFLNFTLETIFNVPLVMSADMDYWACTMLPLLTGKKSPLLFTNPSMFEVTKGNIAKLWPGTTRVYGDANATLYATPLDNKDIICKFDPNFETYIESESPRLQFVMIKRHLMLKDAVTQLINHIRVYGKIVLEFYVSAKEKTKKSSLGISGKVLDFGAKKSGKSGQFLHLMAILDVAVLLYPGVKRVRLAAPLTTFSIEEASKYGGLEDSFFVPIPKKETKEKDSKEVRDKEPKDNASKKDNKSLKSSKSSKVKLSKGQNMKEALPSKPAPPPEAEPSVPIYNEDGKPCFVVVAIELSTPLVLTRKIEDLREELSLLLKEKQEGRHLSQKCFLSSYMTFDYYKEVLGSMITDLNQKFSIFMDENPPSPTAKETFDDTARRFVSFLKFEGIYESYVSSITQATTLIVSRKFQRDDFHNSREFQKFVGEVFVFLISRMNQTVNRMMCHGLEPTTTLKKTDKFFFFAKEAMDTGNPKLAERYFLERICNDIYKADPWFDYGVYLLEQREDDKAYECMKEALLKYQQHKYSLLVLGVLLCNKGQKEDAETCFLNLMVEDSTWTEGWAVLYLFYQKTENYEGMDKTIGMANKYGDLTPPSEYFSDYDELVWTRNICPKTVFFRAATLLLKLRLYEWCELALAQEINTNPGLVHYLLSAMCYYKKLYRHAIDHIEETFKYYGTDYAVSSLTGHCLLALNREQQAKEHYYHALESFDRPVDLHLTSVNLAKILEQSKEDQEARKLILLACKYSPTPYTWYLAGILYYQENDLLSAEDCFSEGNLMDNRFAEIWGYLALVNYKLERQNEAELCLDQALKNNLSDGNIAQLIKTEMCCSQLNFKVSS